MPGTAEPTAEVTEDPWSLSVLVMARVAWGLKVSESVAVTVVASDADAEAVLARVPVAVDRMVATTVYVTEPPAGMVAASLMLPDPLALKPVAPPAPEAVQLSELMAALVASGSLIVTPVAGEGPEFEATIV